MARRELKDLSLFTFLDIKGKEHNLKEFFVEDEDFWTKTKGKKKEVVGVFIKHPAIQRLAREAAVQMGTPTMLVQPVASNEQQHLFMAEFSILASTKPSIIEVGEASTRNTRQGVSRDYMGTMGFKRLFDRGVLNLLGFYELYSEEEAEDFKQDEVEAKVTNDELQALGVYMNGFANAKTPQELDLVLKDVIAHKSELNNAQRNYLRVTYKKNLVDLELAAESLTKEKSATDQAPATPSPVVAVVEPPNPLEAKKLEMDAKLEAEAKKSAKTVSEAGEKLEVPFD